MQVRDARGLPLQEKLAVCTAMKLRGNDQMRIGSHDEACQTYEQVTRKMFYWRSDATATLAQLTIKGVLVGFLLQGNAATSTALAVCSDVRVDCIHPSHD